MARQILTAQQQVRSGTRGGLVTRDTAEEVEGPGQPRNCTQAQVDLGKARGDITRYACEPSVDSQGRSATHKSEEQAAPRCWVIMTP
jgi:hypothetical protein